VRGAGWGIGANDIKSPPLGKKGLRLFREASGDMVLLVIDEVSMLSAEMLEWTNTRLGELFGCTGSPFGGCSVLLLGDLFQLPPVEGRKVWKSPLWREFDFFELTESVRHQDDRRFGEMCTRLREHHPKHNQLLTDDDWALLESLVVPADRVPGDVVALYSKVSDAEARNMCALASLTMGVRRRLSITIHASDRACASDRFGAVADAVHQAQHLAPSQTAGIPHRLQLAEGLIVSLTSNIDKEAFLVNGQRGKVVGWDLDGDGAAEAIYVEFFHPAAGQCRKSVSNRFGLQAVPIKLHSATYELASGRKVTRVGFPLVPASAITIHKSQGQTYADHAAELGSIFAPGQAYVAISRGKVGRRADGGGTMIINGVPRHNLYCDVEVLEEMQRLRELQPRRVENRPAQPVRLPAIVDDPLL
jgi:hypothetical protein